MHTQTPTNQENDRYTTGVWHTGKIQREFKHEPFIGFIRLHLMAGVPKRNIHKLIKRFLTMRCFKVNVLVSHFISLDHFKSKETLSKSTSKKKSNNLPLQRLQKEAVPLEFI